MRSSCSRVAWCRRVHPARLGVGIVLALSATDALGTPSADAAPLEFSEGFLIGAGAMARALAGDGSALAPGLHTLDITLNGEGIGSRDLRFTPAQGSADPDRGVLCLPTDLVPLMDLRTALQEALLARPGECVDLPSLVDGARVEVDTSALRVAISIPQASRQGSARGQVPRSERDNGITAAFLDYTLNHARFPSLRSTYFGATAGLNLGAWRLRHRGSFLDAGQGRRYQRIGTLLQRDLPAWDSQLLLGEADTRGDLFPSVAFTGLRIETDERMLPDSLRGYAPRVQGIADSNAVVTVRQNGNIIHQSNVAPGPFLIEDLYPTNYGGDLEITVTEADGRERRSTLGFSAVPQALRAGASRSSATAGRLHAIEGSQLPLRFIEATYARGLDDFMTLIGGAQIAEHYRSTLGGAAINTPAGAFGVDVTHARTTFDKGRHASGNSLRLNYQRFLNASATHVGLAAYRYSTRNFLTLAQAAHPARDGWSAAWQARQRYEMNLSQRLGMRSALSLTAGHVAYWNAQRRRNDLQVSFQSSWQRASYGLSATRYRQGDGKADTRVALNVSIPLGRSVAGARLHVQASQAAGHQQGQLGLNGSLGERRNLSYSLSASEASSHATQAGYLNYQGPLFNATAGYTHSTRSHSSNASVSGSAVLHGGGLTFGQPMGESAVLVQAPGAEGARVGAGRDIRIGRNGHAVLPHVSAYRWNRIELDPSGLPIDVELLQSSRRVAPTAGSIVRVAFPVRRERTLFIEASDAHGRPLPFAAPVLDPQGTSVGAVGQGSVIQLRGASADGVLDVQLTPGVLCRLSYQMPEMADANGLHWTQAHCTAPLPDSLQVDEDAAPAATRAPAP